MRILLILSTLLISTSTIFCKEVKIGVVNFTECMSKSDVGKVEIANFEKIKQQITTSMTDLQNQFKEVESKLKNQDLLDSLSPEAEQDLRIKFATLREEIQTHQQQCYQVAQKANLQIIELVNKQIRDATQVVSKQENLDIVLNAEMLFHYIPSVDVTNIVIEEMNKIFIQDTKDNQNKNR